MKRAPYIRWSEAELAWIEAHKTWPRRKAHAEFCERFGRSDVSLSGFISLCKRRGWLTGRCSRRTPWSEAELAWVEAHKTWPQKKAHAAFCRRFGRSDVRLYNYKELCKSRRWLTGRACRFPAKPLGHEYVARDGYVMISVAEPDPQTGAPHRFVQKHRHLWQRMHGPIPDGHCLKCLDGDITNTDPKNWMAAPRESIFYLSRLSADDFEAALAEGTRQLLAAARAAQKAVEARRARVAEMAGQGVAPRDMVQRFARDGHAVSMNQIYGDIQFLRKAGRIGYLRRTTEKGVAARRARVAEMVDQGVAPRGMVQRFARDGHAVNIKQVRNDIERLRAQGRIGYLRQPRAAERVAGSIGGTP